MNITACDCIIPFHSCTKQHTTHGNAIWNKLPSKCVTFKPSSVQNNHFEDIRRKIHKNCCISDGGRGYRPDSAGETLLRLSATCKIHKITISLCTDRPTHTHARAHVYDHFVICMITLNCQLDLAILSISCANHKIRCDV